MRSRNREHVLARRSPRRRWRFRACRRRKPRASQEDVALLLFSRGFEFMVALDQGARR